MIRRSATLVVRWAAGLVAGLALFAGFLVWRLSAGPVSLDFLAPYVAEALAGGQEGLVVRVDHTLVSLSRGPVIEIVARGVHLGRRDGGAQLALPELWLGLSLRAALEGVVAPTGIVVNEPELYLERAEDGTFHLGLGGETPEGGDWAATFLHDLSTGADRRGLLGYLAEVTLRHARLTVDDRAIGVTWRAERADMTLFRSEAGVYGDVALAVAEPGGLEAELHGDLRFVAAQHRIGVQLGFSELRPTLLADAAPALAPLAALKVPVAGQVHLEFDTATLGITDAWCDLTLGGGSIVHHALQGGSVDIASGLLRAAYDPAVGRVTLERLRLDLGGPQIEASGTIDGLGGGVLAGGLPQAIDVAADLHLVGLPVDALAGYWPDALSPRTRSWLVEHIHDGVVDDAAAHLGAHVDFAADAPRPVRVDSFNGTLAYRDLTVEYFRPLPPLRGVDGTASFDRAHFDLVPSAGAVGAVRLAGGAAKMSKLDTNDEEIAIDLGIIGPLRDVLEVLDAKPLNYAHELEIDPSKIDGQVDGKLHFAFPLKHDLTLDMVDYGAQASLRRVAIGAIAAGHDLSAGELTLALDRSALKVDGTARIAEVPASLSWYYSLKAKDATKARYTVKARIDDAGRQRLGLDFLADRVQGPVDVDATYTLLASKRATAALSLDLKDATLAVKQLAWRKPAGSAANATLDLDFVDERLRAIRQAALKGDHLDIGLSAAFADAPGGGTTITRVELATLVAGETDVSGRIARRPEGGWSIDLKGLSFDASGLLADAGHDEGSEETEPPLMIDATLDRLVLGPKREARAVKAQLYSDGLHWQAASIDATLFGGGKTSLRFGEAAGDRTFRLSADDLGALLRLFDVTNNIAGGQLQVTGQVEDSGKRRLFRGKVDGANYRLVGAPILAKLLSVASLSGIGALLSGEGIPFSRLTADYVFADKKLQVKDLRAYGGAIGINAEGVYDFAADTLDVSGTLVPAYTLNSVLGNIPVLGKILLGGEGEGIFGANFRVAGPADKPAITVNPLSALAPGVLRKLFLFEAPEPPAATPKTGNNQPQ